MSEATEQSCTEPGHYSGLNAWYIFNGYTQEQYCILHKAFICHAQDVLQIELLVLLFCAVKVPQIVKCIKAHSVENLSYMATLLELAAATFGCAYNYNKGFAFR